MKVYDLIKQLEQCDANAEVLLFQAGSDYNADPPVIKPSLPCKRVIETLELATKTYTVELFG